MTQFWRVVRIALAGTVANLSLHGGTSLSQDQIAMIGALIVGVAEAGYRHFVPHGSMTTIEQIEKIIDASLEEAIKRHDQQAKPGA